MEERRTERVYRRFAADTDARTEMRVKRRACKVRERERERKRPPAVAAAAEIGCLTSV